MPARTGAITFSRCGIIAGLVTLGGFWDRSPRDSRSFQLILRESVTIKEQVGDAEERS